MTDIPITTQKSEKMLNSKQLTEYKQFRRDLAEWLETVGKNTRRGYGFSESVIRTTMYRLDAFHRWMWMQSDVIQPTSVTHTDADAFIEHRRQDHGESDNAGHVKALKRLFKWLAHTKNGEEWECKFDFNNDPHTNQPMFNKEERKLLRAASLEYGSIPDYKSVTPEERGRWKAHLAQRFEKPKSEVTPEDWERANSWKFPSLIAVSLDAGLRPCEVERSVTDWVDFDRGILQIPKEEASKNRDNWEVGLLSGTVDRLERWFAERRQREQYSDTDAIWLTREGNPYRSASLKYVLGKLYGVAGITRNECHWYMFRRSTGTYMANKMELTAARDQLRHKSSAATERYVRTPPEELRSGLQQIE